MVRILLFCRGSQNGRRFQHFVREGYGEGEGQGGDLLGRVTRPIRKYRMTIAHRAAPLDPLDEPLSTLAVAAGTRRGRQVAILSTAGVL